MKRMIIAMLMVVISTTAVAQNATQARKILDKTAAIVGNKGGASANFTLTNKKMGSVSGSISIKGRMFHATTPQAIVWYNGKTQWSYMKANEEVNVTTPNEAQQAKMNPYQFISLYKSGYDLGMTDKGNNCWIHMTAQNKQRSIQEVYILIDKKSYKPSQVKMRQGNEWTTINISGFKAKNLPNSLFTFRAKDYPHAEVIDLR